MQCKCCSGRRCRTPRDASTIQAKVQVQSTVISERGFPRKQQRRMCCDMPRWRAEEERSEKLTLGGRRMLSTKKADLAPRIRVFLCRWCRYRVEVENHSLASGAHPLSREVLVHRTFHQGKLQTLPSTSSCVNTGQGVAKHPVLVLAACISCHTEYLYSKQQTMPARAESIKDLWRRRWLTLGKALTLQMRLDMGLEFKLNLRSIRKKKEVVRGILKYILVRCL